MNQLTEKCNPFIECVAIDNFTDSEIFFRQSTKVWQENDGESAATLVA
jgi:hypothetical protein